jgi:8-oxo-dGTP pyrophosphatase MutT (NUDIX family)
MSDDEDPFVGKLTQKAILFGPDGDVLVTCVEDHWEPPGGTFEYGETLVGGLRRELREELDVEARVGPPVEAIYGGWIDGETHNPMVTLVYRCETDERDITLNEEHDDYEWLAPDEAAERFGEMSLRLDKAVRRAATLDTDTPFEAVEDPYAEEDDFTSEEALAELAEIREDGIPDEEND